MRHSNFKAFFKGASLLALSGMVLTGCSDAGDEAMMESAEYSQAEDSIADAETAATSDHAAGADEIARTATLPDIPVSTPKIAYVYNYGYELPGDAISDLQKKHADLCEAQGPFSCRIIAMSHSGDEGEYANGRLQLAVAAAKARSFGEKLGATSSDAGGEQVSTTIQGEDLSKQLVDTEARLRARTVLRDRLLEVLRTRRGSVAELVEAERSVARVNEEIDQANSWLQEMRTRVAFSRVDVDYRSTTATGGSFIEPIQSAFASVGTILGSVLAGMIMLIAGLLPLGMFGYAIYWLRKRFAAKQQVAATQG